ncbi:zinc finger CCCH domain-containing protein 2-like protein [Tanacetum coccineum]
MTMDGACTKKSFHHLDIPPRKLLSRNLYQQNDSPKVLPEETLFHKFLPSSSLDDESDPYASDHFRMYEFKIRKCTRSRPHDWTDCPFAHPGEKARRRCPRRFNYSGTICVDFRRGSCVKGDTCEFAHGVFECWLHPNRYRTEACKDGKNCRRKICFFAHTSSQLRSLSPVDSPVSAGHCAYCRCHPGAPHSSSPTSILDMEKVLSPPSSPFFSPAPPAGAAFSPVSRFSDRFNDPNNELMNPHAIFELMHSMKTMNMHASEQTVNVNRSIWKDSFVGKDDQPSFFAFSPPVSGPGGSAPVRVFAKNNMISDLTNGPDLKWVNDLLT